MGLLRNLLKLRKIHRLIDEIQNPSTDSPSNDHSDVANTSSSLQVTSGVESPSKRRRITPSSFLRNTSERRLPVVPQDILAGRLPSTRPASSGTTTVRIVGEAPRVISSGNYAPWNQQQFLARLKTFTHDNFKTKPDQINEPAWAKRGWSCVGDETLACSGGCEARVVIDLKVKDDSEEADYSIEYFKAQKQLENQLVEKYAEQIVDAHGESCPWRQKGCGPNIQNVPLYNASETTTAVFQRYESLLATTSDLPPIVSTPPEFDIQDIIKVMPKSFIFENLTTDPPTEPRKRDINLPALNLAVFGWAAHEYLVDMVSCSSCFRRVGLWMYHSEKEEVGPILSRFEAIGEHRDYCPWVNAQSQNAGRHTSSVEEGLPAWKILLQVLNNAAHLRRESATSSQLTVVHKPLAAADGISSPPRIPSRRPTSPDNLYDDSINSRVSDAVTVAQGGHTQQAAVSERRVLMPTPEQQEAHEAEEEKKDRARRSKLSKLRSILGMGKKNQK